MGLRACINSCIVVAFGNEGSKMSSLSNHVPHITISSLGLTRNRRERAPTATNACVVRCPQLDSRYIVKSILTRTRLWLPPLQTEAELFSTATNAFTLGV
jgi:hypothetical protein